MGQFQEVASDLLAMPANKRPTDFFYVDLCQTAEAVRAAARRQKVELDARFTDAIADPRIESTIIEELHNQNARLMRERKAGKSRARKGKALAGADVDAPLIEARGATLQ